MKLLPWSLLVVLLIIHALLAERRLPRNANPIANIFITIRALTEQISHGSDARSPFIIAHVHGLSWTCVNFKLTRQMSCSCSPQDVSSPALWILMATPQFSKSYVRISACTLNTVWFYPDTDVCQALNTQKKKSQAYYLSGIRTHSLCNSSADFFQQPVIALMFVFFHMFVIKPNCKKISSRTSYENKQQFSYGTVFQRLLNKMRQRNNSKPG